MWLLEEKSDYELKGRQGKLRLNTDLCNPSSFGITHLLREMVTVILLKTRLDEPPKNAW